MNCNCTPNRRGSSKSKKSGRTGGLGISINLEAMMGPAFSKN